MENPISFKRHRIKALNETRLDFKSDLANTPATKMAEPMLTKS
jgi:hypothetical protein